MTLLTVNEAIARKVPGIAHARHRDWMIIEAKCPKCGSQVVCIYDDLGVTDYYDNYAHICLNPDCDFFLHKEEFTCNMGGRGNQESEECIFCSRHISMTA